MDTTIVVGGDDDVDFKMRCCRANGDEKARAPKSGGREPKR